jgi:hypothetical protein
MVEEVPNALPRLPLNQGVNYRLYGNHAYMLGWSMYNATTMNPILQIATVKILSNRDCTKLVSELALRPFILDLKEAICSVGTPPALLEPVRSCSTFFFEFFHNSSIINLFRIINFFSIPILLSRMRINDNLF